MSVLKKLCFTILFVFVFLAGYAVGGQIGLFQLQDSVTNAVRAAIDPEAAESFLNTIMESETIRKITEITTCIMQKLLESICNLSTDVL